MSALKHFVEGVELDPREPSSRTITVLETFQTDADARAEIVDALAEYCANNAESNTQCAVRALSLLQDPKEDLAPS